MEQSSDRAQRNGPGDLIRRIVLFSLPLIAYLVVVAAIDPRGEFGTKWLPPSIDNARVSKLALFDARTKTSQVGGLVLGSSRSMYLPPRVLEDSQHIRYFNFAVNSGNIEDYLAVFRWAKSHDPGLRSLIVGIEAYSLYDGPPDADFLRSRPLIAAYKEDPAGALGVPGPFTQWATLLEAVYSWPYAKAAAYGLALRIAPGRVPPATREDSDGVLREMKLEQALAAGQYRLEDQMPSSIAFNAMLFSSAGPFSEQRRQDLESLVREARASNIAVTLWITCMHPAVIAKLRETTPYVAMLAKTRATLDDLARRYGVNVYDFSSPDAFGGSDAGFYDGGHVDPSNAALIAAKLSAPH